MAQNNVMNREPIFWTTTVPGYNEADRQRHVFVDDEIKGRKVRRRVLEKFPQRGHLGDYESRSIAPGNRWMLVVRHDGHEVRAPLTNAAAHMDDATGYGKYMRGKAAVLGWFDPRQCPCALLSAGALQREHIASKEVYDPETETMGSPCAPGSYQGRCKHSVAEKAARCEATKLIQDEREEAFRTKEDKLLELMREQIESQAAQTAAIVARINAQPTDQPPTEAKKK